MDAYRMVEKLRPKSPITDNEIRVTSKGFVPNFVYYATALLQERRGKDIVLKAMGQAITKTVTIAELIKVYFFTLIVSFLSVIILIKLQKRFPGLHQDTAISSVCITDVWEPNEEGLDTVEKTFHVSMISITLSENELNKNSPGYQAPSHVEQGKQYNNNYLSQKPSKQSHEGYSDGNEESYGQGNGRGRGKEFGNYQGKHPGNCRDEEEEVPERTMLRSWDDGSDDCVILEEDPDKPVKLVNEKVDNDCDDLLVISEKGQVACRDYPHPRHICATFPFATTPHNSHCDKCHCYVCDTIDPCVYWGNENSLAHCNATDKIAFWRLQREKRNTTLANIFTHSVPLLWPLES